MKRELAGVSKRRSRKPQDIIRVGDNIEILEPYVFIRCGYALTLQKCRDAVRICPKSNQLKQNMLKTLPNDLPSTVLHKIEQQINNIQAQIYIHEKNFGGRERTLHTKYYKELLHKEGVVKKIKFHKTGQYTKEYFEGGSSYYGDDYYYEQAYLENEKTHKILLIEIPNHTFSIDLYNISDDDYMLYGNAIWIEDVNVKKYIAGEKKDGNICSGTTGRKIRTYDVFTSIKPARRSR